MKIIIFPSDKSRTNQYLQIISEGLRSAGATVIAWNKRKNNSGKIDVIFLHWPENKWAKRGNILNWLSRERLLHELRKLKKSGTLVVWTAHNYFPHSWKGPEHEWISRSQKFFDLIDGVIHLSEASRNHSSFSRFKNLPSGVIVHPHYDLVNHEAHAKQAGKINRLLMLGANNPRKMAHNNIVSIISILPIIVTGKPPRRANPDSISDLIPPHLLQRLTVINKFLSDEELNCIFDGRTATLITQENILNSGVMFFSLSRGAPVICPRSATNELYQNKFGSEWVRIYDPPVDPLQLKILIDAPIPSELPALVDHDPKVIGKNAISIFQQMIESKYKNKP